MMAAGRGGRLYLNQGPLTAIDASGEVLWTYPNRYVSVHGSHRAPAASGRQNHGVVSRVLNSLAASLSSKAPS